MPSETGSRFNEAPDPDEPIARFLFSKRHFVKSPDSVKPDAFLPNDRQEPLETSAFRILQLSREAVWELGVQVRGERPESLKGFAQVQARVIYDVSLDLNPDNDPPRHVGICGWPEGQKDAQMAIALRIAEAAMLHRC